VAARNSQKRILDHVPNAQMGLTVENLVPGFNELADEPPAIISRGVRWLTGFTGPRCITPERVQGV